MHALRLPARLDSLEEFTRFARQAAVDATMPEDLLPRLDLVLEEVLVNIFSYAYPQGRGEAEVSCGSTDGAFRVVIRDSGVSHNPLTTPPPDLEADMENRQVGGLGVHLVKQMASAAHYARDNGQNVLTLDFSPRPA